MRAHFLSARSISGDSVAPHRLWLFSFQNQDALSPLHLGFQDPLRFHLQDYEIFIMHSLLLLYGLLGPLLRVLPTLRCPHSLALRHARHARRAASSLHVEGTLVECGDFSSMVGA